MSPEQNIYRVKADQEKKKYIVQVRQDVVGKVYWIDLAEEECYFDLQTLLKKVGVDLETWNDIANDLAKFQDTKEFSFDDGSVNSKSANK